MSILTTHRSILSELRDEDIKLGGLGCRAPPRGCRALDWVGHVESNKVADVEAALLPVKNPAEVSAME